MLPPSHFSALIIHGRGREEAEGVRVRKVEGQQMTLKQGYGTNNGGAESGHQKLEVKSILIISPPSFLVIWTFLALFSMF